MNDRTWASLRADARARVDERDAQWIVERASGWDGAELVAHLDEVVPERAYVRLHDMVDRRVAGEPLQYVLGAWGFRTLDLLVDRRVLIPRPETETTVEVALEQAKRVDDDPVVVVDLGTGSGAIALSMSAEHDTAEVWATDASADALEVARANLTGAGSRVAPRVRLCEGWWFDALPAELRRRVHLVVSNPPYVADDEALPPEVGDWEPVGALFAGPTGLEAIELVLHQAGEWLADHGRVVLELAPHQSEPATALARAAGYAEVEVRPDLTGRDRVLVARA